MPFFQARKLLQTWQPPRHFNASTQAWGKRRPNPLPPLWIVESVEGNVYRMAAKSHQCAAHGMLLEALLSRSDWLKWWLKPINANTPNAGALAGHSGRPALRRPWMYLSRSCGRRNGH